MIGVGRGLEIGFAVEDDDLTGTFLAPIRLTESTRTVSAD